MYDGSIRINTAIDGEGMKAGMRNISKEFQKNYMGLKKANAEIAVLQERMKKLAATPAGGAAFSKLTENIKKAEAELDNLYQKQGTMYDARETEYSGLPFRNNQARDAAVMDSLSKDKGYQKVISEIDKVEAKLAEYRVQLEKTKQVEGMDSGAYAQYQKMAVHLEELKMKAAGFKGGMEQAAKSANPFTFDKVKASLAGAAAALGLAGRRAGEAKKGFKDVASESIPLAKSIFKVSNMFKLMVLRMAIRATIKAVQQGFQDLARYSSNFNSTMSQLSSSFLYARNAITTVFAPALSALTPLISSVVDAFVSAVNTISALTARIFTGARTFTRAKKAQTDYAKSLDGTAASAKKAAQNLAAFDQINVLNTSEPESSGGAGGVSPEDMFEEAEISEETIGLVDRLKGKFSELTEGIRGVDFSKVKEAFNGLKEAAGRFLNTLRNINLEPLSTALGKVVEAATPLVATLFDGLAWFLDNIAGPLAVWGAEVLLPAVLELIASALGVLNSIIEVAKPALLWLWEEFLKPTAEWAGDLLVSALGWLRDRLDDLSEWVSDHSEEIQQFIKIVGLLAAGFLAVFGAVSVVKMAASGLQGILAVLGSPAGVIAIVIGLIAALVVAMGNGEEMVNTLKGAFDALRDFISNVFAGDWEEAWISVKKVFGSVFNAIVIIAESAINLLIKGINWLIGKINTIKIDMPGWVEDMFGVGSIGFDIPTLAEVKLPRIDVASIGMPALATGAVIPPNQQFMAILGDQKSGRNLEAPEGLIRQIMQEELAGLMNSGDMTIEMPVYLDSEQIYKGQKRVSRRRGNSLITGGAY